MIRFTEIGKTKKFNTAYQSTYGRLYNAFLKISGDSSLTKDILQQAYIKVWNKWEELDQNEDLYPLLFTYSKNIFIDEIRKRGNRTNAEKQTIRVVQKPLQADELLIAKETRSFITASVNRMPPRRKEVFLLSRAAGFSHKQIAEKLSLSPNTIERHIQDVLILLKKEIKRS